MLVRDRQRGQFSEYREPPCGKVLTNEVPRADDVKSFVRAVAKP